MQKQVLYLNFDGESNLSYENGEYSLYGINISQENYTEAEKAQILAELQARFADSGIEFTLTQPAEGEFSTIYIGETEAFDIFGDSIKGISETTGDSSLRLDDNAFVLTQNISTMSELIDVIGHEVGHLTGAVSHDYTGNGLTIDDYMIARPRTVIDEGDTATFDGTDSFLGQSGVNGGAIENYGNVEITQSQFSSNTASTYGGALYNDGTATVTGAMFNNNVALAKGGVIYNTADATATISDSTFAYNESRTSSGAIFNDGTMSISGSLFNNNFSKVDTIGVGGAIVSTNNINIQNSTFSYNTTGPMGGALSVSGTIVVEGSSFTNNLAGNSGGAIVNGGNALVKNTYFSGNTANLNGGAIFNFNAASELTVIGSEFYGNTGGAIYNNGKFTSENSIFYGNIGRSGGAVYGGGSRNRISGAKFSNNRATAAGGAIYVQNSAEISGSTFTGNTANTGGAIYSAGTTYIKDAVFNGNTAGTLGGAIYNSASLELSSVSFLTASDTIHTVGGSISLNSDIYMAGNFTGSNTTVTASGATITFAAQELEVGITDDHTSTLIFANTNSYTATDGVYSNFQEIQFNGGTSDNRVYFSVAQDFSTTNISITSDLVTAGATGTHIVATGTLAFATGGITSLGQTFTVNGITGIRLGEVFTVNNMNYTLTYTQGMTDLFDLKIESVTITQPDEIFGNVNYDSSTTGWQYDHFTSVSDGFDKYDGFSGTAYVTGGTVSGDVYGNGICHLVIQNPTFLNNNYAFGGINTVEGGTHTGKLTIDGAVTNMKGAFGGSRITASTDMTISVNSSLSMHQSRAEGSWKILSGGSMVSAATAATVYLSSDSSLTIATDNVEITQYVVAGSLVGGKANLSVTGNSNLIISNVMYEGQHGASPVIKGLTAGGGLIQSANASLTQTGNTDVQIVAGTFEGNIYGGHVSTKLAYAANTTLNGNTSITIDAGFYAVNIGANNIFGGSNGAGRVNGSTSITFSGLGSRLTFTGAVSGDSSGAGTYQGQRQEYVTGDRSLHFTGFTGNFNASAIVNIDTLTVTQNSSVNMTAVKDLSGVNHWDFDYTTGQGVALTWENAAGLNDFTNDTLDILGRETSLDSTGWTVLDGTSANHIAGWDSFNSVTLFGQIATFDSDLNYWSSADYKLFADMNNHDLIVSKIA